MLAQSNPTCGHCALCIVSELLGCTFVVQSSTPPLFAQMVRHGRKKRLAGKNKKEEPLTPPGNDMSPSPSSPSPITLPSGWGMFRALVEHCSKRRGIWRRRLADNVMLRAIRNDIISSRIADFLPPQKSEATLQARALQQQARALQQYRLKELLARILDARSHTRK